MDGAAQPIRDAEYWRNTRRMRLELRPDGVGGFMLVLGVQGFPTKDAATDWAERLKALLPRVEATVPHRPGRA